MKFAVTLKRKQRRHQEPTKISSGHKEKWSGSGLETKVMNYGISANRHSRTVSGPGMYTTKVDVLPNETDTQF